MTTTQRFAIHLSTALVVLSATGTMVAARANPDTERSEPLIKLAKAEKKKPAEKPKAQSLKVKSPRTTLKLGVPSGPAQNVLIRRTLLTLNDANLSGNYSVLRDMSAPGFQAANTSAKLAAIFSGLRKTKIDIAPVLLFDPKLVRRPEIDTNGMLRLSGYMPTKPQRVNFDMLFQRVNKKWLIFGLAVNTSPAEPKNKAAIPNQKKKQ